MSKTYNRKGGKKRGTRRLIMSSSASLSAFQKEITIVFLEMLLMVKLYHWKTTSYATHKATDELYESLNGRVDEFVETMFGKTGKRFNLTSKKQI